MGTALARHGLDPVLALASPSVRTEVDVDRAARIGDGTGVRADAREPFPFSSCERLTLVVDDDCSLLAFLTRCGRIRRRIQEVGN
jgi:hypothetical protein